MTARTCAGCDLCCTTLAVDALAKPCGARCPHLAGDPGHSCGIYAERPDECARYACVWLEGLLPERLKPSRCGFVVNPPKAGSKAPIRLLSLLPDAARPRSWVKELPALSTVSRRLNMPIIIDDPSGVPVAVLAPSGRLFLREEHPELFRADNINVGVPITEFVRNPLTDPLHRVRR